MAEPLTLEAWRAELDERLAASLRGPLGELSFLRPRSDVADDVTKVLIRDRRDRPRAVLLHSSAASPDLVARGMRMARESKKLLDLLAELDDWRCVKV